MKWNKNKLIGAIRFLQKEKMCLLMLFLTMFALFGNLDAQTPQIWPVEICFNYESGNTNDAVTIRKNASTEITVPEYVKDTRNESCAYIMGQSNCKIKVKFNSNNNNMNYLVRTTVISGTGIGNVCGILIAPCDLNKTITIELSGAVPGSIGKHNFTWKWEATALPINAPYCPINCTSVNTTHTYYTLLATPQAPMSIPWSEVLDKACVWANGQNTNSSVLHSLTSRLYLNSGLDYDGNQSHYEPDNWPYYTKFTFHLTDFLNEWNKADCQDCSMFLSILSSSIGASLTQTRRIQGSFYTKNIEPIGTTYGWITTRWSFHHVGWLNNVYDPAIKINQSSPYIPIDKNIENQYKTDLYSSGTWSPFSAFYLGQTDPYWGVPTEIK